MSGRVARSGNLFRFGLLGFLSLGFRFGLLLLLRGRIGGGRFGSGFHRDSGLFCGHGNEGKLGFERGLGSVYDGNVEERLKWQLANFVVREDERILMV